MEKKSIVPVILLGLVSLITDVSSEMILPLLPLFIASLGGTGIAIGLIGGTADALASMLKALSGYVSDRAHRRRAFVFVGYTISCFSKLLYAFAFSWLHVLLLRVGDRIGKGIRTAPRDALIAHYSKKAKRARAFGIVRAMDSGGAIIGSVLALILFGYLMWPFRNIFLIAGAIGFLALVPLAFIRDPKFATTNSTRHIKSIGFGVLPKEFKKFLIVAAMFSLANFTYMLFVLKAAYMLGEPNNVATASAATGVLALYILFNISYTLFSVPAGILSDNFGRKRTLLIGYISFAATCLLFTVNDSVLVLTAAFTLYGIFNALVEVSHRTVASVLVGEELQGTALGSMHALTGATTIAGSIIAGMLFELITPNAAFYYGAGLALTASVVLAVSFRHREF